MNVICHPYTISQLWYAISLQLLVISLQHTEKTSNLLPLSSKDLHIGYFIRYSICIDCTIWKNYFKTLTHQYHRFSSLTVDDLAWEINTGSWEWSRRRHSYILRNSKELHLFLSESPQLHVQSIWLFSF